MTLAHCGMCSAAVCGSVQLDLYCLQLHTMLCTTREPPEDPLWEPRMRTSSMHRFNNFEKNGLVLPSAAKCFLHYLWSVIVSEGLSPSFPPSLVLSLSLILVLQAGEHFPWTYWTKGSLSDLSPKTQSYCFTATYNEPRSCLKTVCWRVEQQHLTRKTSI